MTASGTGLPTEPHWQKLYEAAILEVDLAKLPDRIEKAKNAILTRVLELRCDEENSEMNRLNDALNMLDDLLRMLDASQRQTREPQ
jgi:hypothetical protein